MSIIGTDHYRVIEVVRDRSQRSSAILRGSPALPSRSCACERRPLHLPSLERLQPGQGLAEPYESACVSQALGLPKFSRAQQRWLARTSPESNREGTLLQSPCW